MGSWSESCGFSGLEIGEGDVAYVCLIGKSKYGSLNDGALRYYAPTTTLLRGKYNDYGYLRVEDDEAVLALFNAQSGLELKNGEDFSIDHMTGEAMSGLDRWWIHGDAFDFMGSIVPDFPYARDPNSESYKSIKIKDIAAATNLHLESVRKAAIAARDKIADVRKRFPDEGDGVKILVELALTGTKMRDVLGYRDTPGLEREAFQKAIENGDDLEPHLESYRRPFMLSYALFELRRNLALNESCGPQHGGHRALRQFGRFLVKACNAEIKGQDA